MPFNNPQTMFQLFHHHYMTDPDRTLFRYKGAVSWEDMTRHQAMLRVASAIERLQAEGYNGRSHVAIISENTPEWILMYLALNAMGVTVVPVDPLLSDSEICNILIHSDATGVITSDGLFNQISNLLQAVGRPINKARELLKQLRDKRLFNINSLLVPADVTITDVLKPLPTIDLSSVASIIYTSGSTGAPKGVMLTHRNIFSLADSMNELFEVNQHDRLISILPFHHVYSFCVNIAKSLESGSSLVFVESLKGEHILEAIEQGHPSIVVVVPQVLDLFLKGILNKVRAMPWLKRTLFFRFFNGALFCQRHRLPNVCWFFFRSIRAKFGPRFRFFVSGGSSLNPSTLMAWRAFGMPILEGYGLTETSSAVVVTNFTRYFPPGTIGVALKGTDICIARPNADGVGEIRIKSPCNMKGYYKNEQLTKDVFDNGWFCTGDLGYLDGEGNLYISGRLKNIIVLSSGKNVYPDELINYYATRSTLLEEICVFGHGARGQEKVAALIYPKKQYRKRSMSELNTLFLNEFNQINKGLPSYKIISEYKFSFEALPKTTTRKFKVNDVKDVYELLPYPDMVADPHVASFDNQFRTSAIGKQLKRSLPGILDGITPSDIHYNSNLNFDLGLDSLSRLDLITLVERDFGVILMDEQAFSLETVGDLYDEIEARRAMGPDDPGRGKTRPAALDKDAVERIQKLLNQPKPGRLRRTINNVAFRVRSNVTYEGLRDLPRYGPFILYAAFTDPEEIIQILRGFDASSQDSTYVLLEDKFKDYLKPIAPFCNVVLVDQCKSNEEVGQLFSYLIRNRHIVLVHSDKIHPKTVAQNKTASEIMALASAAYCPIIPVKRVLDDSQNKQIVRFARPFLLSTPNK